MQESAKTRSRTDLKRFTLDGSDALEVGLGMACNRVLEQIRAIVGPRALEALVLGGGYGRGQGGVLKTSEGDRPYNDLEFYVLVRGNRLWRERRCRAALGDCAQRLSPEAGVHIELKVDSLKRLQQSLISMFSYDLVVRQRIIYGDADLFRFCQHHLLAEKIPVSEATRLLFNRCTGLLLSKQLLLKGSLTAEEADFTGRNLAKAQLALGDAVLTAFGQYHWDCLTRHARMEKLRPAESMPWLRRLQALHREGVAFKLRPQCIAKSVPEFKATHSEITELARQVWLWLEARRLNCNFSSVNEYAFHRRQKCAGTSAWKNLLLNVRTFGPRAALDSYARRYPRERLFNALSLLLWDGEAIKSTYYLQKQLRTDAYDWSGFVNAYKQLWPAYG